MEVITKFNIPFINKTTMKPSLTLFFAVATMLVIATCKKEKNIVQTSPSHSSTADAACYTLYLGLKLLPLKKMNTAY